jgi:transglutaminase-like putative cysteine protease
LSSKVSPQGIFHPEVDFVKSRFSLSLFVAATLILFCAAATFAQKSFTVKPAESWVRSFGTSTDSATPPAGTSSSVLIEDLQTRVSSTVERYSHYQKRVDNTSGLDDLSQLRFNFEPSYQQLTIHYVRIKRGNATIEALKPAEVKMIQQEDELDQQLYNGTMAAVIFVNDLRVGDIVDYAYTITGENPVLGGRFADVIFLAGIEPIQEQYIRLLYPSARTLALKTDNTTVEPKKQTIGDDTELFWYQRYLLGVSSEEAAVPNWYNPYPHVTVSEFPTWAHVVNWALPYYQIASLKNPELLEKIEQWKRASDQPGKRAIAALRFVQDEIRYLGIELGRYSHQPTEPEKVFARRFGDCKDKSLLLSSMLAAMGIEAVPALVNSETRWTIDAMQPSPFAFDHVIVNAKIDGKTYWFDPTISYQRGGLEQYYDPPYERSLVLRANSSALEKIPLPGPQSGALSILQTYKRMPGSPEILMTVQSVHSGLEADEMRYRLSTSSLADLSKSNVNYYSGMTSSIKADGLPVVHDDQDTNTLTVDEKYLIDEFWKDGRHRFWADGVARQLYRPRVAQTSTPIAVPHPTLIKQKIVVDLGSDFDFPLDQNSYANDTLRFDYQFSREDNKLVMEFTIQTFAEYVSAERAQEHLAMVDEIQRVAGFDLGRTSSGFGSSRSGSSSLFQWIGWLIFLPMIVLFFVWLIRRMVAKRRVSEFVEKLKIAPGSSPETALQYATPGQLESALVSFTCRCGGHPYDPVSPPKRERFSYDGQRLIGIRFQCAACKQSTDLYVNVLEENQPPGLPA